MEHNIDQKIIQDSTHEVPEIASVSGWKEVPLIVTEKSREALVPVGMFSDFPTILTSSVYANEHHNSPYSNGLEGSDIAVFMRAGVAERLSQAATLLPRGDHLMVMDAYRSLEVQGALYSQYYSQLQAGHPDWSESDLAQETQKYVSIPSSDPLRPSPHNTGASVDVVVVRVEEPVQKEIEVIDEALGRVGDDWQRDYLLQMKRNRIIRRHAVMLNFGTPFDHGGPEAALRYLEEKQSIQQLTSAEEVALSSRRTLFQVMASVGFMPYADEWWHYNDPASQMGAKVAGRDYAEYGAATLNAENQKFALMRRTHHQNSVRLARGEQWTPPRGLDTHYRLARAAVFGDNPQNVWHLSASVAKIAPSKVHT